MTAKVDAAEVDTVWVALAAATNAGEGTP